MMNDRLKALDVLTGSVAAKRDALTYFADKGMSEDDVMDAYWGNYKGTIDTYLWSHNLTRYQVASKTSVKQTQLARAADKGDVRNIKLNVIFAIAETVEVTPGEVLDALIKIQYVMNIEEAELAVEEKRAQAQDEKYLKEHADEVDAALAADVKKLKESDPEGYRCYQLMVKKYVDGGM